MRYLPLEQRAAALLAAGHAAWYDLQRLALEEDDVFDSLTLLGHELWLPHHEAEGREFRVTLRVAARYPEAGCGAVEARAAESFAAIEARHSGPEGVVRIALEPR